MNDANKIFYEEVREKKATASGVHGKKGKKGHVGKMITPADLSGHEYRQTKDLPSFNVYDFLHKLQEAPTLKSVLLARLDEEYRNYRLATEKTLDAVAEIMKLGIDPLYAELAELKEQVAALHARVEAIAGGSWTPGGDALPAPASLAHTPARGRKRRIRWGSTPEAIRQTVFHQLRLLIDEGEEISTETIKQRCPSMLRWIYGDKAVFEGIEGLRREFFGSEGGKEPPLVQPPAGEDETEAAGQQELA